MADEARRCALWPHSKTYLMKSRQDLAISKQVHYEAGKTSRDHSVFSQGISNMADLVITGKLHMSTGCIHPVHRAVLGCLAEVLHARHIRGY